MSSLKLLRFAYLPQYTLGHFFTDSGLYVCDSLELPWRGNKQNVSCIPCGEHPIEVISDDKIRLHDVPGRIGILIHTANRACELQGCIAPGLLHNDGDKRMVIRSRQTVIQLVKLIRDRGIERIVIRDMVLSFR